jgi:NADH-quinone oxidoreductase subunit J
MCCLAGLFVTLGAIFLATLQVIVYAGAIMVLFVFVIMLLNLRKDEFGSDSRYMQKYFSMAFVAIILVQTILIISISFNSVNLTPVISLSHDPALAPGDSLYNYSSAKTVAETLFTKFTYPFEVTSILLLAAIIGAVVIARKKLYDEPEAKS